MNILTRRARIFSDKLQRDDLAIEDWNRVLDIDYANLAALRAFAAIRRRQGDAERARSGAPPDHRPRAHDARRGPAQGDLPRAGQDVRRAAAAAVTTPPRRGGSCSTSAPTSRRWTRSRGSTAPKRSGPTSSTSRCSARAALEDPAAEDRGVPGVAALWRDQAQEPDAATRGVGEDPRDRRRPRRGVPRAREAAHGGERWEPLVELYLVTPRYAHRDERARRSSSARSRACSKRSSTTRAGARRAHQRARGRLPRSRDDQVPRAHGASHGALGRGHPDREPVAPGADGAEAEDPALPPPRQVVRRRPRTPRVRAALLRADRPARPEQRRRAPADGAALSEERRTGSSSARRSRARSTSP